MPSIETYAPRDLTEHVTIPFDGAESIEVEYFINRITTEGVSSKNGKAPDMEARAEADAQAICSMFAAWNLTGPLRNRAGEVVVAEGEVIPLEPDIVRLLSVAFRAALVQRFSEAIRPKLSALSPSRRR